MRSFFLAALVLFLAGSAHATDGPAARACPSHDELFSHSLIALEEIAGISPLGKLGPSGGHMIPTRHLYFYPRLEAGTDPPVMRETNLASPGDVELVVAEYHPSPDEWNLHIKPCRDVTVYVHDLKSLSPDLLAAVGPMDDPEAVRMPGGQWAKPLSIRLAPGQLLGVVRSFDVGVHDFRKPPHRFANPHRYALDRQKLYKSYPALASNEIALAAAEHMIPQSLYNRCPLDYFEPVLRAALTARLGDYDGDPRASGRPPCHSNMQDVIGSAQGNWWSDIDPLHDAIIREHEQAIALVNWAVDPRVQLFTFNRHTPGLRADMLEPGSPPEDIENAFMFPIRTGGEYLPRSGSLPSYQSPPSHQFTPSYQSRTAIDPWSQRERVNRKFADVRSSKVHCYEGLQVHGGGRRLEAVVLIQLGKRATLRFEFVRAANCAAVPSPWTLSPAAATYYR